jgi:hypothetical protein
MTILDSLDTLWIAGMKEEFDKASEWVEVRMEDLGGAWGRFHAQ